MNIWYSAKDLTNLPELPRNVRNITIKAQREKWKSRKRTGRGGGFEYHIESIPKAAQAQLLKNSNDRNPPRSPLSGDECSDITSPDLFKYDKQSLWANYESKTENQKETARKKLDAINLAFKLIENGTSVTDAWIIAADTYGVYKLTVRNKWYAPIKNYDRCDWLAALVPQYMGRTKTAFCDPAAWTYFTTDYLRLEKPTVAACYNRLKRAAESHGWKIPSVDTIERRIKEEIPATIRILKRDGEQALYKLYPAQQRTVKTLHALEAINGDGYQHNVFVKYPGGEIARPKVWYWQDIYSRKILSYRVDRTENTDSIRLSFGDLIEQYGIPKHVTIDNTRAAANKWMTGSIRNRYRFKVKDDDPIGLFPTLDIEVHWTSVFNGSGSGQSKPIERTFGVGGLGEVVDKHPALAGCYTGPNPTAKPENYASRAIPLDDFLKVLEQEIHVFNAKGKRRTEICNGVKSYDDVFNESYKRSTITKCTDAQRRLWYLTAEAVKVQRDGTITLDAGSATGIGRNRYRTVELYEYIGKKIVARFDPQQLHNNVYIYSLNGVYLGRADCIDNAGFYDTQAAREHNRARKQMIRSVKDAARAEEKMTAVEAAAFLPTEDAPQIPKVKVVRAFTPVTDRKIRTKGDPVVSIEDREKLNAEIHRLQTTKQAETPRQRYQRWCKIDAMPKKQRTEPDHRFWQSYQKSSEYRGEQMVCDTYDLTKNFKTSNAN